MTAPTQAPSNEMFSPVGEGLNAAWCKHCGLHRQKHVAPNDSCPKLYHCANCNTDYDFATQGAICPHKLRSEGGKDRLEAWPVRSTEAKPASAHEPGVTRDELRTQLLAWRYSNVSPDTLLDSLLGASQPPGRDLAAAAQSVVEAYESRFESGRNVKGEPIMLFGPIDDEIKALRSTLTKEVRHD